VPRFLIFNATPASAEQRLVDAGSQTYDELIQSSLDRHLPSGMGARYFTLRGQRLPQGLALDDFDAVWVSGSPFNAYKPEQPSGASRSSSRERYGTAAFPRSAHAGVCS
jgi:hypothetical protein